MDNSITTAPRKFAIYTDPQVQATQSLQTEYHQPEGVPAEKVQTTLLDYAEPDPKLMTPENRHNANEVLKLAHHLVEQVTEQFRKEDRIIAPMYLYELYGVYIARSVWFVHWTPVIDKFWIGDSKNATARWSITDAQLGLRYKMIKDFVPKFQEGLVRMGYADVQVLLNSEVSYPRNNRFSCE